MEGGRGGPRAALKETMASEADAAREERRAEGEGEGEGEGAAGAAAAAAEAEGGSALASASTLASPSTPGEQCRREVELRRWGGSGDEARLAADPSSAGGRGEAVRARLKCHPRVVCSSCAAPGLGLGLAWSVGGGLGSANRPVLSPTSPPAPAPDPVAAAAVPEPGALLTMSSVSAPS
mmetsp:Transcript_2981/g.9142  ORF Transcript_2981/g.9142 Transcript_2981/m.9142 type:complete len:179 (-) Transcript_2981:518-1054(-)